MAGDPPETDDGGSQSAISKADVHLVVAIFLGSLIAVQAWDVSDTGLFTGVWDASPSGTEDLSVLATSLFDTWVIPFEVLSLLLLVALIGGIAMAIKEGGD